MDLILDHIICQANGSDITANSTTNSTTVKFVATPNDKAFAYFSLCLMTIIPIVVGSFRSVKQHKKQQESTEKPETMSTRDACMFPFIASFVLLSIYIVFKLFSKEHVNFLLTLYFFILGIFALTHVLSPLLSKFVPSSLGQTYSLQFIQQKPQLNHLIDFEFSTVDVIALVFSSLFSSWYLWKKHWIANNVLGLAFSINGIELLHLNTILNGCILLGGLFFYDIFWVFGTDVMVTVAKSFEAPIKLVFPQDFLVNGVFGSHFFMLGLGDIVVPGIFISLLLRYDKSLKRDSNLYFIVGVISYVLGLITTGVVLTKFNHAQPALLYLVPSCVLTPLTVALLKGDLKTMFAYQDHPAEEEKKTEGDNKAEENKVEEKKPEEKKTE